MSVVRQTEILEESIGSFGSVEITGTSAVTPPSGSYFCIIDFMSTSIVAAQVDSTNATNADLTAFSSIPL